MMEIERKILEIKSKEVVAQILRLRPRSKVFEGLVRVKYFDFAMAEFASVIFCVCVKFHQGAKNPTRNLSTKLSNA